MLGELNQDDLVDPHDEGKFPCNYTCNPLQQILSAQRLTGNFDRLKDCTFFVSDDLLSNSFERGVLNFTTRPMDHLQLTGVYHV